MSYHMSPKIIPRVRLSPKIKFRSKSPGLKKSPRKIPMSPKKSPQRNRSKAFLEAKEKFRSNPTVNPITNRTIKINGDTYKKLVKLYGKPY